MYFIDSKINSLKDESAKNNGVICFIVVFASPLMDLINKGSNIIYSHKWIMSYFHIINSVHSFKNQKKKIKETNDTVAAIQKYKK